MLSKSEQLLYFILGLRKNNILPAAYTLDFLVDLIFRQNIPVSNIMITKMVYPKVAVSLHKSSAAIEKSVQRLIRQFWDTAAEKNLLMPLFGRPALAEPSVSEILFYLAFLLYTEKPFFSLLDDLSELNLPSSSIS